MCPHVATNNDKLMMHVLGRHQHEGRFRVACMTVNCKYKGTTWKNFKQHCRRQHGLKNLVTASLSDTTGILEVERNESEGVMDMPDSHDRVQTQRNMVEDRNLHIRRVAQFLLGLQTQFRISQAAVQSVWEGLGSLLSEEKNELKESMRMALVGADADVISRAMSVFDNADCQLSPHLSTDYRRHKYYSDHFHFVEPQVLKIAGTPQSEAFFIPFVKQLQVILSLPEMQSPAAMNPLRQRTTEFMHDFSDGGYCRNHDLANKDYFVQIIISYDELELMNPLRSNKCHKMAMFYFTLGNIPPCFRSKLSSIFLLAVAKSVDMKKGVLPLLLEDFMESVKALRSTGGLKMQLPCGSVKVTGDLIAVLCDTPAAALMGGFKESVAAYKLCRMCHANKDSYKESFRERDFQLRTMQSYLQECAVIDTVESPVHRNFFSKAYGINKLSVLSQIPGFPVTSNILQDPMHCLLEGAYAQTLALLLQELCLEMKLFTLDELNAFLQTFPYSYVDRRSKPYKIERVHITQGVIKQKAATMLMLTNVLPFFLGQYATTLNGHYQHYLLLTHIIHLSFSPKSDETTAVILSNMIEDYCSQLEQLYPHDSVKPKSHFLVHFPSAIREFGPLKNHSTMRFEGKHGFFKTQKCTNFRNVPKTLAYRHQLHSAYLMTRSDGNLSDCFFSRGDEVAEGTSLHIRDLSENLRIAIEAVLSRQDQHMYITPRIQRKGKEIRPGVAVCQSDDEFDGPTFEGVKMLLVTENGDVYVCMQAIRIVHFRKEFNAYEVCMLNTFVVRPWLKRQAMWPLPIVELGEKMFITNRNSMFQNY
jgi:hypothetical protein